MSELNPCPFCGGDAEIVSHQISEDGTETYVCCKHCGARTEGIEAPYSEHAAATSEWNSRPTEKAAREEVLKMVRRVCRYEGIDYAEDAVTKVYKRKFGS